MQTISN